MQAAFGITRPLSPFKTTLNTYIRTFMKVGVKLIRLIFSIYGFFVFILFMLLLFPFVVISSFFGKIKGGNMIYRICTLWTDLVFFFWGFRHKNYYEAPLPDDHARVFVFNHISYIDIPLLLKAFRNIHIRVLGKAEMTKVPIFGYIYKRTAITVDRSSAEARAVSVKRLKYFLNRNISVVIAPEGTFNTTHEPLKSFYDGAFRIAIETQTPIRAVIFPDSYNRLHYESIFSLTPGRTTAVFLEEIPVTGLSIDDIAYLKERVFNQMEHALIRYKAGWIKTPHA